MILIAGGCGYIGSHVNKELNRQGYKTITFDNLSRGHIEFARWGETVCGDLADLELLRSVFHDYPVKAVMHFSAYAYVGESVENPELYYDNNVGNTLNLLRVMREYEVKHFIFSSTCATYGMPVRIPISEDLPQNPINPYGFTKLIIERALGDYAAAYGMRSIILRYFNAAGADPAGEIGEWHEPETHLVPLLLDVAAGKSDHIKVFGTDYPTPDGTCIRDYIHVTDLARAHILALEYLQREGINDSFNLGNGEGYSVREVITAAEAVTGVKIKTRNWQRREGDPPVLIADSSKAGKTLQWQPQYPEIETIIDTAWKWHRRRR